MSDVFTEAKMLQAFAAWLLVAFSIKTKKFVLFSETFSGKKKDRSSSECVDQPKTVFSLAKPLLPLFQIFESPLFVEFQDTKLVPTGLFWINYFQRDENTRCLWYLIKCRFPDSKISWKNSLEENFVSFIHNFLERQSVPQYLRDWDFIVIGTRRTYSQEMRRQQTQAEQTSFCQIQLPFFSKHFLVTSTSELFSRSK